MPFLSAASPRVPAVARYEFGEPIGTGGVGTVYRALDRETGSEVAIKVLRDKLSDNPAIHQRFVQEFRAATQLEHPNIVRALDMGIDGNTSYLVYELVEGTNLGDRVIARKRLPEAEAVQIITQVAQALQYAHLRGVVHRDVKPDNILVLPDGRAKLTDFGLAKDFNNDMDLTRQSSGLGTPNFMAPEQFSDAKNVGPRADVYALSATLYAAVTGLLPFAGKTTFATLVKKEREVPSARAEVPELSERLDAAIRAALHPKPDQRPRSCLEFFKLLTAGSHFADGSSDDLPHVELPAPPPDQDERRAWVRHELDVGACGIIDTNVFQGVRDSEEFWPLVVRDLSAGGVGVLLARRFELGTELSIEFSTGPDSAPRRLTARVVRVVPEKNGHWVHGCAFAKRLGEEELATLLRYA
jgi:serine/threonine protein kinase